MLTLEDYRPNPGSPGAVKAGCICDPEANMWGEGRIALPNKLPGKKCFTVEPDCQIHGWHLMERFLAGAGAMPVMADGKPGHKWNGRVRTQTLPKDMLGGDWS